MTAADSLRPATPDDVPACLEVFYAAGDDLAARNGQPPWPRDPVSLAGLFQHLIETDPGRTWVAEGVSPGLTAFGLAHRREHAWFLAFLFVRPESQGSGLGRRLVDACLARDVSELAPSGPQAGLTLAVCAESTQPISLGLYARYGMLPRVPLFALRGRLDQSWPASGGGQLPGALEMQPLAESEAPAHAADAAQLDRIDRAVLGYAHGVDHRFWHHARRQGYLFRRSTSDEAIGYGYVHRSGRLGPVAVTDPNQLAPIVARLSASIEAPQAWQVFVPGPSPALVPLFGAGLRIDEHAVIYAATGQGPAWDRYIPANYAVL